MLHGDVRLSPEQLQVPFHRIALKVCRYGAFFLANQMLPLIGVAGSVPERNSAQGRLHLGCSV